MASYNNSITLKEFEPATLYEQQVRPPGEYTIQLTTRGNSILSTLEVVDLQAGATVDLKYVENAVTPDDELVPYELGNHLTIDTAQTIDKETIGRTHGNPVAVLTVTGGWAEVAVRISVVQQFATDLDTSLVRDAQSFDPGDDRGVPTAGVDEASGVLRFLRLDQNGYLLISGDVQSIQKLINTKHDGTFSALPAGNTVDVINVTTGAVFTWLEAHAWADDYIRFDVFIDGALWYSAISTIEQPNVNLFPGNPLEILTGLNIKVTATNLSDRGEQANGQAFFYGSV